MYHSLAPNEMIIRQFTVMYFYRMGANLVENSPVRTAIFDKQLGLWTAEIEDSEVKYQVCLSGSLLYEYVCGLEHSQQAALPD